MDKDIPMTIHRGFVDFAPFDIKIHISTILITITPSYQDKIQLQSGGMP
ncbi:hypothetical protein SAMN05444406_12129 [Caldicoprobacter faecalis]|uniref:Uncharacterized protein n=1 Tax=Caldicoprobacter faecalis TaxID=937334 RepID=A0A1I5X335_9FIRM|nr:hypothetical protein SAMN05444406_12129 [Caldicoprobacter faecalis]